MKRVSDDILFCVRYYNRVSNILTDLENFYIFDTD